VFIYLVVEFIVTAEHDETTPRHREGKEHLFGCLSPNLKKEVEELCENFLFRYLWILNTLWSRPSLGNKQLFDPFQSSIQRASIDEKNEEEEVRESGCEVNNLST
jgi:hypothetical protein